MATLWDEKDNEVMIIMDNWLINEILGNIHFRYEYGRRVFTEGGIMHLFHRKISLYIYKGYYLTL